MSRSDWYYIILAIFYTISFCDVSNIHDQYLLHWFGGENTSSSIFFMENKCIPRNTNNEMRGCCFLYSPCKFQHTKIT